MLTPREAEVLRLAADALTNTQIAGKLGIAESTVKRHLTNAYARLGADSRIDAINKAVAFGVIKLPTMGRVRATAPSGEPAIAHARSQPQDIPPQRERHS